MPVYPNLQDPRRIAAALIDAWNTHDVEGVVTLCAPGFEGVDVAQAGVRHGVPDVRRDVEYYLAAFPDLQFSVESQLVEGDHVALLWTASGTHTGPLMHIPPTGRAFILRGASFLTVEEGLIVRCVNLWDVAGFLRTIGLLPELPRAPDTYDSHKSTPTVSMNH